MKLLNPLVAQVIAGGLATLNELRSIYSLEDLYALSEILSVRDYNSWKVNKLAREKAECKRMALGR